MASGEARAQGPPLPLARVQVLRDSIGLLLARALQLDTLRVVRLNTLAFALRTNEAGQSLALTRQAVALARRLDFERGLLEAQFTLGYYFRVHSQYDSAIYYTQQALTLAVDLGNRYTQTRVYLNLVRIYFSLIISPRNWANQPQKQVLLAWSVARCQVAPAWH
jgi:hypothetical protein